MKGVLLAGGTGSRLYPLTKVTNKHLLPVYNKPMIYYPLQTLIHAGINDILIVSGAEHCGQIISLLGDGSDFNVQLTYKVQTKAGGIAQALSLAETFVGDDSVAVILGDNIYSKKINIKNFDKGCILFLKEVDDPDRFGVAEFKDGKLISLEEKPKNPKSNFAVTGFYVYDKTVFSYIKQLKSSKRNELEITEVNEIYVKNQKCNWQIISGDWTDAGTVEGLHRANRIAIDLVL